MNQWKYLKNKKKENFVGGSGLDLVDILLWQLL
jgi:hypothetical protein